MTENVASLRSVKVATPPCAANAAIPCGLAVRKQHKMLFAASKFETNLQERERMKRLCLNSLCYGYCYNDTAGLKVIYVGHGGRLYIVGLLADGGRTEYRKTDC